MKRHTTNAGSTSSPVHLPSDTLKDTVWTIEMGTLLQCKKCHKNRIATLIWHCFTDGGHAVLCFQCARREYGGKPKGSTKCVVKQCNNKVRWIQALHY